MAMFLNLAAQEILSTLKISKDSVDIIKPGAPHRRRNSEAAPLAALAEFLGAAALMSLISAAQPGPIRAAGVQGRSWLCVSSWMHGASGRWRATGSRTSIMLRRRLRTWIKDASGGLSGRGMARLSETEMPLGVGWPGAQRPRQLAGPASVHTGESIAGPGAPKAAVQVASVGTGLRCW
jgi:hypothetical protein